MTRLWTMLAVGLLCAGCAVGPRYVKPAVAPPPAFKEIAGNDQWKMATPLDDHLPSNDVDFFINGQTEIKKNYSDFVANGGGVQGPYGHLIRPEPRSSDPGGGR